MKCDAGEYCQYRYATYSNNDVVNLKLPNRSPNTEFGKEHCNSKRSKENKPVLEGEIPVVSAHLQKEKRLAQHPTHCKACNEKHEFRHVEALNRVRDVQLLTPNVEVVGRRSSPTRMQS